MVDKVTHTLVEFLSGHPGSYTANVLSAVQVNQKQWGKKKEREPGRYTKSIKDAITGKKNKWYGMNSSGVAGVEGAEEEETQTPHNRKVTQVGAAASTEQEYATGAQEMGAGSAKNKIDQARGLFQQLHGTEELTRKEIIAEFVRRLDMKESTAISYYERIAKELGLTGKNKDEDSEMQAGNEDDVEVLEPAAQEEPVDEMPEEEVPEDEGGDVDSPPHRAHVPADTHALVDLVEP